MYFFTCKQTRSLLYNVNKHKNYFTYLEQESVILLVWKLREVQ